MSQVPPQKALSNGGSLQPESSLAVTERSSMPEARSRAANRGRAVAMQVKPCYRTARAPQKCTICGDRETRMHMPIGHIGYFCGRCCPACTGG
jgi:hypothetical protein